MLKTSFQESVSSLQYVFFRRISYLDKCNSLKSFQHLIVSLNAIMYVNVRDVLCKAVYRLQVMFKTYLER